MMSNSQLLINPLPSDLSIRLHLIKEILAVPISKDEIMLRDDFLFLRRLDTFLFNVYRGFR